MRGLVGEVRAGRPLCNIVLGCCALLVHATRVATVCSIWQYKQTPDPWRHAWEDTNTDSQPSRGHAAMPRCAETAVQLLTCASAQNSGASPQSSFYAPNVI